MEPTANEKTRHKGGGPRLYLLAEIESAWRAQGEIGGKMELYRLESANALQVTEKYEPAQFKKLQIAGANAKEGNLEDLIVARPGLLNQKSFELNEDPPDLLIIHRQPVTSTHKRADLFAVDRKGSLVIVEIKRDALDQKVRSEAMEFQAIRYAASSRKMTASDAIDMYAAYLKADGQGDKSWRDEAVTRLKNHLAEDEEEELTEEDVGDRINPGRSQKIYLVAAGFDPDVISACAWLREHKIDVYCFQLTPYRFGNEWVLGRERLIPPPGLDDFMLEMAPTAVAPDSPASARAKSDKPVSLTWLDNGEPTSVSSWREAYVKSVSKLITTYRLDDAHWPQNWSSSPDNMRRPEQVKPGLFVETSLGSAYMKDVISAGLRALGKPSGFLEITTESGKRFTLP